MRQVKKKSPSKSRAKRAPKKTTKRKAASVKKSRKKPAAKATRKTLARAKPATKKTMRQGTSRTKKTPSKAVASKKTKVSAKAPSKSKPRQQAAKKSAKKTAPTVTKTLSRIEAAAKKVRAKASKARAAVSQRFGARPLRPAQAASSKRMPTAPEAIIPVVQAPSTIENEEQRQPDIIREDESSVDRDARPGQSETTAQEMTESPEESQSHLDEEASHENARPDLDDRAGEQESG